MYGPAPRREFVCPPENIAAANAALTQRAAERDAARRAKLRPVVERMAEAMRELSAANQTVDGEALANRGFTMAEIEAHGRAARDLANRRATRQLRGRG